MPEKGIFACGAHSDFGMLTFLLTDEHAGLEVQPKNSEEWIAVAPHPDRFVVNLGDMLQRWTNDFYCSTLHRVVNRTAVERFSVLLY